jgi:serine/threonine protein kinase
MQHQLTKCRTVALTNTARSSHCLSCSSQVAKFAWQIVEALQYLHRRGLCHGHLSASSIYVARRGVLKLANHWASPAVLQALLQASGNAYTKVATPVLESDDARLWDLRCLGVLLLQLHTPCDATLPQHAGSGAAVTAELAAQAPALVPEGLSDAARSLIVACLTAAPAALTAERLQCHPYFSAHSHRTRSNSNSNSKRAASTPRVSPQLAATVTTTVPDSRISSATVTSSIMIGTNSDVAVDSSSAAADSDSSTAAAAAHNASTPLVNLGPQQSGCTQQQQQQQLQQERNSDDAECYSTTNGAERTLAQVAFLKTLSKATG